MIGNPNQLINMMGGIAGFNQRINTFGNNFKQQFGVNANPRDIAQQILNSGQVTQEQFEQARQIANSITGMNI